MSSQATPMLFTEANTESRPIPPWARFLLDFGWKWPRQELGVRRIAVISMPCDSAAAGLIALGTMIRDLQDASANDLSLHSKRLVDYARSYTEHCSQCGMDPCDPKTAQCGLSAKVSGLLRSTRYPNRLFHIQRMTDQSDWPFWVIPTAGGGRDAPLVDDHQYFYINGEPAPQWVDVGGHLPEEPYRQLIGDIRVFPGNLGKSYSGICLAGRAAGEESTREACATVQFHDGVKGYGLEELLTVYGWSECNVSRVSFFNSRTDTLHRNTVLPSLVVADGDASFLRAVDKPEFQQSDIVGVIHRTMERDKLEAVGNRLVQLNQWYLPDFELLAGLPAPVRGISVSVLRRRV